MIALKILISLLSLLEIVTLLSYGSVQNIAKPCIGRDITFTPPTSQVL